MRLSKIITMKEDIRNDISDTHAHKYICKSAHHA